jgi:hypothetical protein
MDQPFVENDTWIGDEREETEKSRRWPIVVVSVAIVVVAIGVVLFIAAKNYQPLSQSLSGEYGSQITSSNGTLATNRVAGASSIVWTEPSGSFHVEVVVTLNNDQRFPVTIDKVLTPPNPSGTSDAHVYFDSKPGSPGAYGFKGGPSFKPTTLASGGQLVLVEHWNQECVPTSAASSTTTYVKLPVEYTFVSFHHTVTVPIKTLTITPRSTC